MEKIINQINLSLLSAGRYINKISPTLFIFVPLSLLYLSHILIGNEEQYMQLAKQFVNPDWIFESQNLTETAGTRLLYQIIVGNVLKYLSFETTVFVFRFLLVLGFSVVLGKVYKVLSLDNHQLLLHLVLFILIFNQSFFAGSWMLVSVEPKSFAYLAVLLSFYYLLKNRFGLCLTFLVVASYFHILVGGYTFVYIFLALLLFRKDSKLNLSQLLLGVLVYILVLIPFVIYLKTAALDYIATSNEVSPSWIYTYYRAPHHTALFKSTDYFISNHFFKILDCIVGLLVAIIIYVRLKNRENLRIINQFVIVSLAGALLLVSVAFFDKNGDILKFYLYRINSLSVFFLALLIPIWIYTLADKNRLKSVQVVIFVSCLTVLAEPMYTNVDKNFTYSEKSRNLDDISAYIKEYTNTEALVFSYQEHFSLSRKTERNLFFVKKFIPAQLDKIHDWYNRDKEKYRAIKSPEKLYILVNKYNIDYILTPKNVKKLSYKVVYENSGFLLYETGINTIVIKE